MHPASLVTILICLCLPLGAAELEVRVVGDFLILEQRFAGGERSAAIAGDALVAVEKGIDDSYTTITFTTRAVPPRDHDEEEIGGQQITFTFSTNNEAEKAFRDIVEGLGELDDD